MLNVVCWKWKQLNYRSKFIPKRVGTLRNMVARNLSIPHRFLCITDEPEGIDCETIPIWTEPDIVLPQGRPNCYRRLKLFSKDAQSILNCDEDDYVLSIDLDTVIVSDFTDLIQDVIDRNVDFKIWGDTAKNTPYNGSFWMLKLNSRNHVWETLLKAGERAPILTKDKNYIGSDQGWMAYSMGEKEERWTSKDGIYSFRNELTKTLKKDDLPENAKIVFFHGKEDPWNKPIKERYEWVNEFYG